MPAWFYVVAVAAVLFAAWVAFARRWWHAVWYSWRQAAHAYQEIEAEFMPAPLQGSMVLTEEISYWNGDWREQTRVELAPETLDLLAAPPDDPGPGDDLASSSPSPGPDQELCAHCGQPALGYARGYNDERLCHHEDRDCYHRVTVWREPTRLAGTGDLAAAHEAHPSPDWLAAQMAVLYDWVRWMVPQVTGWSVGA